MIYIKKKLTTSWSVNCFVLTKTKPITYYGKSQVNYCLIQVDCLKEVIKIYSIMGHKKLNKKTKVREQTTFIVCNNFNVKKYKESTH